MFLWYIVATRITRSVTIPSEGAENVCNKAKVSMYISFSSSSILLKFYMPTLTVTGRSTTSSVLKKNKSFKCTDMFKGGCGSGFENSGVTFAGNYILYILEGSCIFCFVILKKLNVFCVICYRFWKYTKMTKLPSLLVTTRLPPPPPPLRYSG
jgi:hypothetical protein